MAFELFKNSTQKAQFFVLIILSPLGVAVTGLRFVAAHRGARKPALEDWLAVLATVFFLLTNLAGLAAISILNGRSIAEEVVESPSDYKAMRKWDMAGLYFYFAFSLFAKLAVLALYHRIFGVNGAYRIWIWILATVQTILFLIFCIFQALHCKPFKRYFDIRVPGTCKEDGLTILAGETPNSLIDFAMVILVMFMIRPRRLTPSVKLKLRLLFGLGAIVGTLGFIKIIITYSASVLYAFSMVSLWTCVQSFAALLCASLPVIYHILPANNIWPRLTSRMSSYAKYGRSSRSRTTSSSTKDPRNPGGHDLGRTNVTSWKKLDEENSTSHLAWPRETHQTDSHALSDFPIQGGHPKSPGIKVERRIDIV